MESADDSTERNNDFPFYQSHEGIVGMSNSRRKWERLQVPANLKGSHVLDIGCNEGLLTSWCAANGADNVIGIDFDKPRIAHAQKCYGSDKVEFRTQSWAVLPDGPFELILWTSAMHYESDPKSVIAAVHHRLTAEGLFILECGVIVDCPGREMISISRHSDVALYPTIDYLMDVLLADFSVRRVTEPELTPGDAIPRAVFHCRRRRPTVLFVVGKSGVGKTDLVAKHLGNAAEKVVSLDVILSRVAKGEFVHGALQELIKANYDPKNLGTIYDLVQEKPIVDSFLSWLAQLCAKSDELVVIEGDLLPATVELFRQFNADRNVWMVTKV